MVGEAASRLGAYYEAPPQSIDFDAALSYARATNDHNPLYQASMVLPPIFAVVPVWPTFTAAVLDLVPPAARPALLHAGHEMDFHHQLPLETPLHSSATLVAVRSSRMGSWLTLALTTTDGAGASFCDQWATLFIRGFDAGPSGGVASPGQPWGPPIRVDGVAVTDEIDADQAVRYAEASGDDNPIHVDPAAAIAAGLPGVILHGLCSLAVAAKAVVAGAAGRDPRRLSRIRVRFSEPVFPGSDFITSIHDPGGIGDVVRSLAFEVTSQGRRVIKDGTAEIRPVSPQEGGSQPEAAEPHKVVLAAEPPLKDVVADAPPLKV